MKESKTQNTQPLHKAVRRNSVCYSNSKQQQQRQGQRQRLFAKLFSDICSSAKRSRVNNSNNINDNNKTPKQGVAMSGVLVAVVYVVEHAVPCIWLYIYICVYQYIMNSINFCTNFDKPRFWILNIFISEWSHRVLTNDWHSVQ